MATDIRENSDNVSNPTDDPLTYDDVATLFWTCLYFPSSTSVIFSSYTTAAGNIRQHKQASRTAGTSGAGAFSREACKSHVPGTEFWGGLSTFLCSLFYFPFNDIDKDKNLPFRGAKMRPKPENSSQKKRNTGRLWCAISLSECGKPTPMVVLWGGNPGTPKSTGQGKGKWLALGTKARGLNAHSTAWDKPMFGVTGPTCPSSAVWAPNTHLFTKGREALLHLLTST